MLAPLSSATCPIPCAGSLTVSENLQSLKTLEQSRTRMITGFESESSTKWLKLQQSQRLARVFGGSKGISRSVIATSKGLKSACDFLDSFVPAVA